MTVVSPVSADSARIVVIVLGMAALIEVHTYEEMERVLKLEHIDLLGINNRDLASMTTDLAHTFRMLDLIEDPAGQKEELKKLPGSHEHNWKQFEDFLKI